MNPFYALKLASRWLWEDVRLLIKHPARNLRLYIGLHPESGAPSELFGQTWRHLASYRADLLHDRLP